MVKYGRDMSRSFSFDSACRGVLSRVEKQWARLTFDETLEECVSVDGDNANQLTLVRSPSAYRRLKTWLKSGKKVENQSRQEENLCLKIENVRMLDRYNNRKPSMGTLYLTTTHLIFVDPDAKKETWILLMHIAAVQKLPLSTVGAPLYVRCKTFLAVTFVVPKERDCHDLFTSLMQMAQPIHLEDLYCFHYTSNLDEISPSAGWKLFELEMEFQRMGLPNDEWVQTNLNKDYELCDTYPQCLFVPAAASTIMLVGSASFRSKGRLPVLTYLHKNKAALCRCSQPLSGFSARCVEDEQLMNCIVQTNPNAKFMYVVDTRPRINAMANRAAGKGYENENFYENIKFQFCGIENIHVMRSSLTKLLEACDLKSPSMGSFLSGLQSSGWLRHIHSVLETSVIVAQSLMDGLNVLVHCSDGWDRTAQVCSLAQVIIDPYYRTLQGIQTLIEKDWLSFGHKFTDRCGHLQGDAKEVSPIFTQFIECCWQMLQMHLEAFQFNERFLLTLHDHVFSCQYGTFVGNCEKDRLDLKLADRTYSFWGQIFSRPHEYTNPLYKAESYEGFLNLNLAPYNIAFWRGLYCRFESGVHPRESLGDLLLATRDHSTSMEMHISQLEKRISELKNLLGTASLDNRIAEDDELGNKLKNTLRLVADHPLADLKDSVFGESNGLDKLVTVSEIRKEVDTVALDWKTTRNKKECICSTPFDHHSKKAHCWHCGEVFCTRCIDKQTILPGHGNNGPVPVCRTCYKDIRSSSSSSATSP